MSANVLAAVRIMGRRTVFDVDGLITRYIANTRVLYYMFGTVDAWHLAFYRVRKVRYYVEVKRRLSEAFGPLDGGARGIKAALPGEIRAMMEDLDIAIRELIAVSHWF